MMMGSWLCNVSSEIHINGQRFSESVREDKGKTMAMEPEDEKDLKRARVVPSKGREVVRSGYSSNARCDIGDTRSAHLRSLCGRVYALCFSLSVPC
jgi:hypothetical protein